VAGQNRVEVSVGGTVRVDPHTLLSNRPGVFAGGDVVRGPNTVVDAIADGKLAAVMIGRHLRGEPLRQPSVARVPSVYVEPVMLDEEEAERVDRPEVPRLAAHARCKGFDEVEMSLAPEDARREARRCLRCDLEFTKPAAERQSDGAAESREGRAPGQESAVTSCGPEETGP